MATLTGRVALVTGASRGIGAAIAIRLAQDGAAVALTYGASRDKADDVVRRIEAAGGKALALRADSADADAVRGAVAETVRSLGGLDVLVSNAGVARFGTLDTFTLEDFDSTIAINVRAVFVAAQAAARHMQDGSGRIITIGSTNADRIPFAGAAVYAMSKAAIAGLTRGLARDLGPRGITVNNVQPGPIDTDMNPADGPLAGTMRAAMALTRYGRADEVAAMVAYLAGPEAGFVTGASLTIDGGFAA
ncbi:MAG TPA: 3-oxoacyl-ACP reductase family protein [Candidatus Binatia bacterium]|jgi:3-oxoacyl-[acyl-carrier protein] reductase|nr:3-oxoacyl-ACP reductase family protein [Candidatus Binatia bacterium]